MCVEGWAEKQKVNIEEILVFGETKRKINFMAQVSCLWMIGLATGHQLVSNFSEHVTKY